LFRKHVEKIQVLLKSDKNNGYFTYRPSHFSIQLMHTTLKNVELLKHFKISKTAPTCFGLRGYHHQGATIST